MPTTYDEAIAELKALKEKELLGGQGYSNYETLLVVLHYDNDARLHAWARNICAKRHPRWNARILRQQFTSHCNFDKASVYSGLLNASADRINWVEVAEHFAAPID